MDDASGPSIMNVTTYYLQMFSPSTRTVPPPRDGITVVHARKPTVGFYRYLYDAVGRDYHWASRRKLSDEALAGILNDPRNELHVLWIEGVPAGFAELDRRIADEIELVQFGLTREFIGQGLGKYFLQWTIEKAWSYQPRRFWLHTCTNDHTAALPNYLKAGLTLYRQEVKEFHFPAETGHVARPGDGLAGASVGESRSDRASPGPPG